MFLGLFFCIGPFSKSPLCQSPPRKFPSCALQEAVFLSILIGSCRPLFIHLQGKGIPAHVALPAICIQSFSHSDAGYCLSKCVSIPSILFPLSIRFLFSV